MIPIASNHSEARKKTHNWFEHVQPATTEEVKKMCKDLPPGFKHPPSFAKKFRVVGKKKSDVRRSQELLIRGSDSLRMCADKQMIKTWRNM